MGITNKAHIYFDFNAPVETNTASTKIVLTTNVTPLSLGEGLGVRIFPNPANEYLSLTLSPPTPKVGVAGTASCVIKIFDVLGKEIYRADKASFKNGSYSLSFGEGWGEAGLYFVEVQTGKEIYRAKFVKE